MSVSKDPAEDPVKDPTRETSKSSTSESKTSRIDHFVRNYGDLLFDLCESILWNNVTAQVAVRSILKKIRNGSRFKKYSTYERSWVLQIACARILIFYHQGGRRVSAEEQIKLDANENVNIRMKQFHVYFHRLAPEDQILLLLRDKYGIPYSEISSAMSVPEGSLKIQRQQALRTLEEWLWKRQ